MGDAQRHKQLDFIKPAAKTDRFSITLMGEIEQSYVAVKVRDASTELTETLQFHLYIVERKMYAEVFYSQSEADRYSWVGSNIDRISGLICQRVCEEQYQRIGLIDSQPLERS
jgi:hypothetical protein